MTGTLPIGETSAAILERFRRNYVKDIDLTLRPAYRELLAKLGNPHRHLPPVFHVAGTNGKGSVCAFLRAMLEAGGYKVHVYTSPHLINYHERIRIAGELINEAEFVAILKECENLAAPNSISVFEILTAAALTAFARHPADFVILETGLGGRLDATNIIEKPLATIITRISYDHREYLGETLAQIAGEKAGIMKEGVPCFVAQQPDNIAMGTLLAAAQAIDTRLLASGKNWTIESTGDGFYFIEQGKRMQLPPPALPGAHQYQNAGLAIAALSVLPKPLAADAISQGLQKVEWLARLQKLQEGALPALLPQGWELWLDGGHNDSAGEVLAAQAQIWGRDKRPLYMITGMLKTKHPQEFLKPLAPHIAALQTVMIPDEAQSLTADELAADAARAGVTSTAPSVDLYDALKKLSEKKGPARILICGSLYLAGHVLALDQRGKI